MNYGVSVVFIPFSWALGVWRRPHKTMLALGPFRLGLHRDLPNWKDDAAADTRAIKAGRSIEL